MLIILQPGSTPQDEDRVRGFAQGLGWSTRRVDAGAAVGLLVGGLPDVAEREALGALPGVAAALPVGRALRHVHVGAGGMPPLPPCLTPRPGDVLLIAGPCAVESEEQLVPLAGRLRAAGADALRGGAFKPRTSPYDFQGLGEEGLRLLALAREHSGLPVITEAVSEAGVELVEHYADVIQIGARNMQNFELLKRVGRSPKPVLLKRGFSASLEDWLLAAEYVMDQGNPSVVLCERGIRTFATHSRFTLDLGVVPHLRHGTRLPVIVDPSHASGLHDSVGPLARAAVAAGAHGVMVEVHPDPAHALSDGSQSLRPSEFERLAKELRALAAVVAAAEEAVR